MGERKRNAHSKVLDKIKEEDEEEEEEGIVARSFVNRVRQFEMRQNTHTHNSKASKEVIKKGRRRMEREGR